MKISYAVTCVLVVVILAPVSNVQGEVIYTSQVTSLVTENPSGTFNYDFTVVNTSTGPQFGDWGGQQNIEVWPSVVDFEIPLDDPAVVQDIQSPEKNWSYEFLSDQDYVARYGEHNPFGSAYVLHWFGPMSEFYGYIVPEGYSLRFPGQGGDVYENQTAGFKFTSSLAPVSGPYTTSWASGGLYLGDPPLPGGSLIGGSGSVPFVPEPGSGVLFASGLLLMSLGCKRIWRQRDIYSQKSFSVLA